MTKKKDNEELTKKDETHDEPNKNEEAKNSCSDSTNEEAELNESKKAPSLEDKIAELEALNAQLQDQYLRKAADFDNYRKRMIKEKQEAIDYANSNLLADLVKVLDDFDRAIGSVSIIEDGNANQSKTEEQSKAFIEGVSMIRNQLGSMLDSKYGLQYYPTAGKPFDPNIHEAVASVPSQDVEEPTVGEELLKGYKLKDRIIRLAQVAVFMPLEAEVEGE